MFTCNVCGRKFKTMQGLGGHMSHAHPQNKPEDQPLAKPAPPLGQPTDQVHGGKDTPENNASEPSETKDTVEPDSKDLPQTQPSGEELGVMDSIGELRKRGYSPKQIKEQFGYARQTVDQVFAEYIPPDGKVVEASLNQDKKWETMPAVYKKDERSNPEVTAVAYDENALREVRLRTPHQRPGRHLSAIKAILNPFWERRGWF